MDDIVIIDDFLNKEELDYITTPDHYHDFFKTWELQTSDIENPTPDFNLVFLKKSLMDNKYYTSYLFDKIKKTFNQNYKLVDVYLNGQFPGRDGAFHTDNADRTVLLYTNDWNPALGGFTHFMKSKTDHIITAPLMGKLVNFKSSILHKGYSFCNQNCPMRITAAFKLKL